MKPIMRPLELSCWALAAVATVGGCVAVALAPVEATMGPVQKLFYLHVPAALCMLIACLGVFIGNIGYLWQRRDAWNSVALVCAELAVVLSAIVLLSGMVWGHFAWGTWWTWSPRLTFSLILALLYSAYLVLYRAIETPSKRALLCSIYGVAAFVDVPLVYLSTKLLPDIHPAAVSVDPSMRLTLLGCIAAVGMASAAMLLTRHRLLLASLRHQQSDREHVAQPPLGA